MTHGSASSATKSARSRRGCARAAARTRSRASTSRESSPRASASTRLCDPDSRFLEIGLLVAYDQYDGQAPARRRRHRHRRSCDGREVVVVANDATVKAGSWWPETIKKILRAQEIAMRCRIPIIYLVDSAGVNLPYQGGVFPGQYGASRIFYYNSIMRRYLRIPQLAAVMGPCIAGGAYLPALSDLILMVKGTSFMGLGGPNLVKGATGQTIDAETLGGAATHTEISGVAHYAVDDDDACLAKLRELSRCCRAARARDRVDARIARRRDDRATRRALRSAPDGSSHVVRHARACCARIVDDGKLDEFQARLAKEMICGDARIDGIPVGVIANQRGLIKGRPGEKPRFGGIIYAESAEKVAYFIDRCDRAADSAAVRAGCLGLHGRTGSGARGNHPRRRALRRSDGDGARAQARADRESRVGRRLLRDGRAGLRSRLHLQLAHGPHGR